ncbi:MAG: hypothetical protein ACI82A_002618 [Candidatus Azotimanducaceae bacterium]|jgi:hypothetical protein
MSAKGKRISSSPSRRTTSPSSTPHNKPVNFLLPSYAERKLTLILAPLNISYCDSRNNRRSIPGDETSKVYFPLSGSSTSSKPPTCRLTLAQSSTSIPASASIYIFSTECLPWLKYSSPQSSKPKPLTTGSINSLNCSLTRHQPFDQINLRPIKNGHMAHSSARMTH